MRVDYESQNSGEGPELRAVRVIAVNLNIPCWANGNVIDDRGMQEQGISCRLLDLVYLLTRLIE